MRAKRGHVRQGKPVSKVSGLGNLRFFLLLGIVVAGIFAVVFLLPNFSRPKIVANQQNGDTSLLVAEREKNSTPRIFPHNLTELLALSPEKLEGTDIALMNLLCAEGLPGAENLNVEDCLHTLDQWARHTGEETERNYHHFREDPDYYYHSEAFYKMLMLAVVVYEDFGVRYNPKWIASPSNVQSDDHFCADSRDVLVHGMVGPTRMGTCSSMPVLYIALGRRLGYPLKLVTTRQHLFMRWDSQKERFDMDATAKGVDKYDDEHYRNWPFPITDEEIKEQDYLKSLSTREELSVFLSIRAACLTEAGRVVEATTSFEAACRLAPTWKGNQIMLAEAQQRQRSTALILGQTMVHESLAVPPDLNPVQQVRNANYQQQNPMGIPRKR